ncbi:MAG: cobyrinate a,c-diamide synthase [Rhodospirillales bacterium]
MRLTLPPGLVISAPRSGSGKTTVTLGLLRAFAAQGLTVQAFKSGPDYIDPAFHARATGRPSFNLDSWAMPMATLSAIAAQAAGADLVLIEGSMGLFDGVAKPGASGTGASADIAALTGYPVLLVQDVSGQAQSAAATALGCARLRPDVTLAGVVLNRLSSPRHRALAEDGMTAAGMTLLGGLDKQSDLTLPERHLGLVQAGETEDLDARLAALGEAVTTALDLPAILAAARPGRLASTQEASLLPPPGQRIALARDAAFSFIYPHHLDGWRKAGAEILPFSPLADQAPAPDADVCWLPGGYPELHAGKLAAAQGFLDGLRDLAARGAALHGECGGYMTLGQGLIDAEGQRHAMAGLLGLSTDFSRRKMALGYRKARLLGNSALGATGTTFTGHEFHYARIAEAGDDSPLFQVEDATGAALGDAGSRRGGVSGSFFHLLAPLADPAS